MPDTLPPPPLTPARGPVVDQETAPLVMIAPDGQPREAPSVDHWVRWCKAAISKMDTDAAVLAWLADMRGHLDAAPPAAVDEIMAEVENRIAALQPFE